GQPPPDRGRAEAAPGDPRRVDPPPLDRHRAAPERDHVPPPPAGPEPRRPAAPVMGDVRARARAPPRDLSDRSPDRAGAEEGPDLDHPGPPGDHRPRFRRGGP